VEISSEYPFNFGIITVFFVMICVYTPVAIMLCLYLIISVLSTVAVNIFMFTEPYRNVVIDQKVCNISFNMYSIPSSLSDNQEMIT
jgi:hypothetical protein